MIRTAILGCGVIAQEHIRSICLVPGVSVVGIADRDEKALAATAATLGIEAAYRDAGLLLEKTRPDAVHVTTPPASHHALATLALEAGCHVFLEKPMTLHAREAEELVALARRKGLLLTVDFNHRFDGVVLEAMKLVSEGVVGKVVGIDSYYGFDLGTTPGGRYFREAYAHWVYSLPGGLFHNGLDHPLSVVVPFMNEPKEVHATAAEVGVLPEGVPGELRILLNDGERVATVTLSEAASPRFHYLHLLGDKGTLQVDLQNKRVIRFGHKHGVPHYVTRAMMNVNLAVKTLTGTARTFVDVARGRFTPYEGQRRLIAEFYRAIETGAPSPLPPEEALTVTRIMDRVWERIGPLGPGRNATPLERWAPSRDVRLPAAKERPRVLVTGATGFIGRRLVQKLCARDKEDVRVLVRNLHKAAFLKELPVEVVYGDLTKDEDVARAMEGIDVVYHLGAAMSGTWDDYQEGTIRGTARLAEAALARRVKAFVHASTIAAYGVPSSNGKPIAEDAPLATKDLTFYMKSKIEAERIVREGIERGLPASILRLGVVFGPGRPQISRLGYHAGRLHVLVGLNNMKIPGVYVDDAIEALVLAADHGDAAGKIYNVVDDPKFTKLDYLRAMARHRGRRNYVLFFPATAAKLIGAALRSLPWKNRIVTKAAGVLNPFHLKSCSKELRFDNSRIKTELGWTPRGNLDEQFRETFRAT